MCESRPARLRRAGGLPARGPQPLPARGVATFAAHLGLSIEGIAARLGLETAELLAFDRDGGPGWLRLALVGVAVERGENPEALTWLMDAPELRPVHDAPAGREPGDGPAEAPG